MSVRLDTPAGLKPRHMRVLAWTDHYFGPRYLNDRHVSLAPGAKISLSFTTDRTELSDVDAVWFHAPSIIDLPPYKDKPWVLMSMESEVNYPYLRNSAFVGQFDVHMTYRLDSDVPCIYPNWRQYGNFRSPPPSSEVRSTGAPAVFVASNAVRHRDRYVAQMMKYMQIDSPGRCLNNADIVDFVVGGWADGAWACLLALLPRYKFYLAFENSIATDYVTERVFLALVSGTIPVYRGAPNVREFMPADDAVIDAADFKSPRELASYLKKLDEDPRAFDRHLAWKREGLAPAFKQLVDLGSVDPMMRLAIKLAHGCDRTCTCGGRLRDRGLLP